MWRESCRLGPIDPGVGSSLTNRRGRGESPRSKHWSSPWPPPTMSRAPEGCHASTAGTMEHEAHFEWPVCESKRTTEQSWSPRRTQRSNGSRQQIIGLDARGKGELDRRWRCPRAHSYTQVWTSGGWASSYSSDVECLVSWCSSTVRTW